MLYRTLVVLLTVLVTSIFTSNVFAGCDGVSCTGVKITRLVITTDGDTVISTSGDESKLSCNAGKNGYLTLRPNASNYNSVYALLLTAHTTGHPLWVRTSESGACHILYVASDK